MSRKPTKRKDRYQDLYGRLSWNSRLLAALRRGLQWRRWRLLSRGASFVWLLLFIVFVYPLRLIGVLAAGTANRLVRSWQSGSLRHLVYGLPFATVLGGSTYLVVACSVQSRSELVEMYRQAANGAVANKSFDAANVYFQRLVGLIGQHPETLYQWAQAAQAAGDEARVNALLVTLAPRDRSVHTASHIWQARRLLASGPTREHLQEAHAQLLRAAELQPDNAEVHAMLGQYYLLAGDFPRAAQDLAIATRQYPHLKLLFAKSLRLQGRTVQASVVAEEAEAYFRKRVASNIEDLAARLGWAESLMFLERFGESINVLQEGLLVSETPQLRSALARVYIAWADATPNTVEGRPRKLELLELGVRTDATELLLFDRIMALLGEKDDTTQQVQQFLVNNLANGQAQMLSHLLLGTIEGEAGDFDKAVQHLEQAFQLDPSVAIVGNNLAWYLMQRDPPELERSLALIDGLARKWPNMAEIRDTRGQILVRLQRWQEAIIEMEAALGSMRGNARLHAGLAEAYSHLNMPKLASEHQKLASELAGAAGKAAPALRKEPQN